MTPTQFRKLLASKNMSVTDAAAVAHKTRRSIFRYLAGSTIDLGVVALIQAAPRLDEKRGDGRLPVEPVNPKARRKA